MKSLFHRFYSKLRAKKKAEANTKAREFVINIENQCYLSLNELPQFNWLEINKNDFKYLFKSQRNFIEDEAKPLNDIYRNLLKEFIKLYGLSEEYKTILQKRSEIAILKCSLLITKDRINQTWIDIAEFELKEMIEGQKNGDFNDVKAYVDKEMGFRIDIRKVSVVEYQGYLKLIQKSTVHG